MDHLWLAAYATLLFMGCSFVTIINALSIQSSSPTPNHEKIQSSLTNRMVLAPLTRGGNLPFRRLCADFGMHTSVSEMIYARSLLKGDPIEKARLRRWKDEPTFGVQFATNQIEEGLNAIREAADMGADFCDLNCGCPIHEATRRGLGSSLLRSPKKFHKLVRGLVEGSEIPITVKIRLGCETNSINCLENVKAAREAGAAAITIHGRTAQQGYSKNADWDMIRQAVTETKDEGYGHIPIIGNGDILTYFEARRRMEETGVDSVMVGRGALSKPWIFKEFNDNATWTPDLKERVQIYRTLASYMKDHFGDDDMGRKKSWNFLPWHFEFLSRYTPYPEEEFAAQSVDRPLIQNRMLLPDHADPLEILLANRCGDAHEVIASILWDTDSDELAVRKLKEFAESQGFKEILRTGSANSEEDKVLTNLPKGKAGVWGKRRGRKPGPKRSEEEIAKIRADRAAKKERILAEGGVWPPN
uniref:tRNA-dihydrouridine(47) synthase [NAD(P)(+)] n=1 Tax=Pseudo-nitzschia australis TaxID=44445 RepID=A0A7S4EHY8_9STRA|mmetsp:Transcript_7490/g.16137  ORF Transcript_7490/g.16137 Transcript_7490/m.16137 type:complete len:473 (-) Transcript_7490:418-1836(-)